MSEKDREGGFSKKWDKMGQKGTGREGLIKSGCPNLLKNYLFFFKNAIKHVIYGQKQNIEVIFVFFVFNDMPIIPIDF